MKVHKARGGDAVMQTEEAAQKPGEKGTCGGNADGAPCMFPFTYKGVQYNECTSTDSGDQNKPWCWTDAASTKWGSCECTPQPSVAIDAGDAKLTAYWDYGICGPNADDYNWDWCKTSKFDCAQEVSTSLCPSGKAKLSKTYGSKTDVSNFASRKTAAPWNININGCDYAYYAQYACHDDNTQATTEAKVAPSEAPAVASTEAPVASTEAPVPATSVAPAAPVSSNPPPANTNATATEAWDLSNCPHNKGGSACWADSAYQMCHKGRQVAYDKICADKACKHDAPDAKRQYMRYMEWTSKPDCGMTQPWDLSECPHNKDGSACWADSAYQMCHKGRQV